jgi:hypothetical protein
VEANLRSGRIRMVFVADHVPKELVRIVEFMNEQMRPAEVLAIEIEHFLGMNGVRTLVPRVVGATARAQAAKSVEPEPVSENEWLAGLAERKGQNFLKGAERALAWFRENGFAVEVSQSQDSIAVMITRANGKAVYPFFVRRSTGRLEASLANLAYVLAYKSEEARQQFAERVEALPTNTARFTGKLKGYPSIALDELLKDNVWSAFQSIVLEVKERILQS